MCSLRRLVLGGIAAAALVPLAPAAALAGYGLGQPAPPEMIAAWDIDIRPDGHGLPPGKGTPADGDAVYEEQCSACHGVFGYGETRYPALVGGDPQKMVTELKRGGRPEKTIGSYWPYASTLFDYVRRAMPFGNAQSLSDDDAYAVVAYLLNANGIVADDFVLNAETLPRIAMPNQPGFVDDPRPDVRNTACMSDCGDGRPVTITSYARKLQVTPGAEQEARQQ